MIQWNLICNSGSLGRTFKSWSCSAAVLWKSFSLRGGLKDNVLAIPTRCPWRQQETREVQHEDCRLRRSVPGFDVSFWSDFVKKLCALTLKRAKPIYCRQGLPLPRLFSPFCPLIHRETTPVFMFLVYFPSILMVYRACSAAKTIVHRDWVGHNYQQKCSLMCWNAFL